MRYPRDNYVFSVPVMFRSKARYEGNGYSLDECWNVVAKHHRDALWVSLSMPADCVAPLDKGWSTAGEVRLTVNIDKLTEHAIITRIVH